MDVRWADRSQGVGDGWGRAALVRAAVGGQGGRAEGSRGWGAATGQPPLLPQPPRDVGDPGLQPRRCGGFSPDRKEHAKRCYPEANETGTEAEESTRPHSQESGEAFRGRGASWSLGACSLPVACGPSLGQKPLSLGRCFSWLGPQATAALGLRGVTLALFSSAEAAETVTFFLARCRPRGWAGVWAQPTTKTSRGPVWSP